MPKRDNAFAGRRPSSGASPPAAGRTHPARATAVVTFTALSEAEWQAIHSTGSHWSESIDWRREIDQIGRNYWATQVTREMWLKKLQGKQPAKQRKKICKTLMSVRHSQKALARVLEDGLLDDDFVHPDFETPESRLEVWLCGYDLWVQPFAGKSNPIQAALEWRLIDLWKRSGGTVRWSRKKDDAGTPYAPLVDFLTLTLNAILGNALTPSGVAKMIDRHRGRRQRHDPFLMYAMDQYQITEGV